MKAYRLRRRPSRSLRTVLSIWFLLFSVVPLAFVTGYSVIKYERAIDNELSQRLEGNAREIGSILEDFKKNLESRRDKYLQEPGLAYNLSLGEASSLRSSAFNWLKTDVATHLTFFHRDGRMILSVFKDDKSEIREFVPDANAVIYLSEQNREKLALQKEYAFVETVSQGKMSLVLFSKVVTPQGKHVGYIEQLLEINDRFLKKLKNRMNLEILILKNQGVPLVGTHADFLLYKKEFFESLLNDKKKFFDINIRGNPYGFIIYPLQWGQTQVLLALGASKMQAKAVLKTVNYAFYSVVGTVILLLSVIVWVASKNILKPLNELLEAIEDIPSSERPFEIPIKSDTEIGLLTESFNQMSRVVIQARSDLRKKISELEAANEELKETQARLVHSAKMVSLGQLVAGVAHELNNPIAFIYSNMSHLKEYSDKLMKLIEQIEQDPAGAEKYKAAIDLEYIQKDLPKLISSCEEGARRTRDIVLGLRNFSRLEEAKLKEINIHDAIDNTLELISGETKGRIQIHKDYGELPLVTCYASQINQVFMNILTNAAQAIAGQGNIWITTKPVSKNNVDFIAVSFQDSGQGMSSEIIEKIFDPFFSTKGVGQGTGLGLSISYGIIQNHGGDIEVKSQIGIGTEFIVTIPVKSEALA